MTRRATRVAAAALMLLLGRALSAEELTDAAAVPRIGLEEFKQAYEKQQLVVVDVRGADAYRAGHVAGAVLIGSGDDMPAKAAELKKSGKTVVTYCS